MNNKQNAILSAYPVEDRYLSRKQAAEFIGVKPGTLANWACIGEPKIPYTKISASRVAYRLGDLIDFMQKNVR